MKRLLFPLIVLLLLTSGASAQLFPPEPDPVTWLVISPPTMTDPLDLTNDTLTWVLIPPPWLLDPPPAAASAVPNPSTLLVLGLGLSVFALWRRP